MLQQNQGRSPNRQVIHKCRLLWSQHNDQAAIHFQLVPVQLGNTVIVHRWLDQKPTAVDHKRPWNPSLKRPCGGA